MVYYSLRSYYRFLHPAFPVLPPPVDGMMDSISDSMRPANTYSPSSPVILAILSILTHLPQLRGHESYPEATDENILERSTSLSQHALHAITSWDAIKVSETHSFSASRFHPNVPGELERPLACCVLSLYHYLCRGDIEQMTSYAQKASGFLRELSSKTTTSRTEVRFEESLRRAWWMTVSRQSPC